MVALRSLALRSCKKVWATAIRRCVGKPLGRSKTAVTVDIESLLEGRLRDADPQVQAQAARALG